MYRLCTLFALYNDLLITIVYRLCTQFALYNDLLVIIVYRLCIQFALYNDLLITIVYRLCTQFTLYNDLLITIVYRLCSPPRDARAGPETSLWMTSGSSTAQIVSRKGYTDQKVLMETKVIFGWMILVDIIVV